MNGRPRRVSSTDFQREVGRHMDEVHAGAVVMVCAHGRPRMVLVSPALYDELEAMRRELNHLRSARLTNGTEGETQR